ncbi:3D domain-containing protein [Clostridium sp. LBM24168]
MVEKLKSYVNKYFSNGPRTASVIITVLAVILIAVVFSMRKTVIISVDGSDKKIATFSNTYVEVLNDNKIKVGPKDKVTPSLNSKIYDNGKLSIKKAVKVDVQVDGKKLTLNSAEDNIFDMLRSEKVKLNNLDRVSPIGDTKLKNGLKVVVTRVESKDIKEINPIKYETIIRNDQSMKRGSKKILQEGQNGENETVTRIIYENGKEISRRIVSQIVKRHPVQKVVAIGTMSNYALSRGGNFSYARSFKMRATAYTADYISTGKRPGDPGFGITATGTMARRTSYSSSVAVDPRVIPLGTKLYIDGYGYAIAEDTGGAIKGNRIDLFFNSNSEANNWGVKWVNVYVAE